MPEMGLQIAESESFINRNRK